MLFKINLCKDKANERDKQCLYCYFKAFVIYSSSSEEEVASKNDSFLKTEESLLAWYVLA